MPKPPRRRTRHTIVCGLVFCQGRRKPLCCERLRSHTAFGHGKLHEFGHSLSFDAGHSIIWEFAFNDLTQTLASREVRRCSTSSQLVTPWQFTCLSNKTSISLAARAEMSARGLGAAFSPWARAGGVLLSLRPYGKELKTFSSKALNCASLSSFSRFSFSACFLASAAAWAGTTLTCAPGNRLTYAPGKFTRLRTWK